MEGVASRSRNNISGSNVTWKKNILKCQLHRSTTQTNERN